MRLYNPLSTTGPPVSVAIEGRHNTVCGGAVSSPRETVSSYRRFTFTGTISTPGVEEVVWFVRRGWVTTHR